MTPPLPQADEPLFALLYVSELAEHDASEVERICHESRVNNERDGVTGLLVFDGRSFCQFVEGPHGAIAELLARLEGDARHVRMKLLHHGPSATGRRFPDWRLGYAFTADPAAIARLESEHGEKALWHFDRLRPALAASI